MNTTSVGAAIARAPRRRWPPRPPRTGFSMKRRATNGWSVVLDEQRAAAAVRDRTAGAGAPAAGRPVAGPQPAESRTRRSSPRPRASRPMSPSMSAPADGRWRGRGRCRRTACRGAVGLAAFLEHHDLLVERDADAGIGDRHASMRRPSAPGWAPPPPTRARGELDRVVDQIRQDLAGARVADDARRQFRRQVEPHLRPLLARLREARSATSASTRDVEGVCRASGCRPRS